MPKPKVVNEQTKLQTPVLIGWGCLIYNYRKDKFFPSNEKLPDYEKLLRCIGVLLYAAGLDSEFEEIQKLFSNYGNDLKLQSRVKYLLHYSWQEFELQQYKQIILFWDKHFRIGDITSSNFQSFVFDNRINTANILYACYLHLKTFEGILDFNKYSASFKEFLHKDLAEFCNFELLWKNSLSFLVEGFDFFIRTAKELAILTGGFSFQDGNLTIDLEAFASNAGNYDALQEQIAEIKYPACINICNVNFNVMQNKALTDVKRLLQALPSITALNIFLEEEIQSIFNSTVPQLIDKTPLYSNANLWQFFLHKLFYLHVHILSMPNVETNNIIADFWQSLIQGNDPIAIRNWLDDLQRQVVAQSRRIQQEEKAYNVLRDQILGWHKINSHSKIFIQVNEVMENTLTISGNKNILVPSRQNKKTQLALQ